jgi:hypothetical protein
VAEGREALLNVYSIETDYRASACVVADSMAEAEQIFIAKYSATILSIKLHAKGVQIQDLDEQASPK